MIKFKQTGAKDTLGIYVDDGEFIGQIRYKDRFGIVVWRPCTVSLDELKQVINKLEECVVAQST